jgi:amino-acid N-acetyltransferase
MDGGTRVALARDVLTYLSQYRGRSFVIRIDDALRQAVLLPLLIRDVVQLQRMGIAIVLVAGARAAIDRVLKGTATLRSGDRRVTPNEALPSVVTATTEVVNELMALLTENGARAVIGNWVRARSLGVIDGVDYQRTGRVERVDADALQGALGADAIPVISNIGWNSVGKAYNISSSELAVEIAVATRAAKLFFVSDRPGVRAISCAGVELRTRAAPHLGKIYSSVHVKEAERLLARCAGQLDEDDASLLLQGVAACTGGVDRVHLVDGRRDGVLIDEIFSADGTGTMLYADRYAQILPASAIDVPEIMRLLEPQMSAGLLIERSARDVAETLHDYLVYRVDETIQGCAALKMLDPSTAEIESLVVAKGYRAAGSGRELVGALIDRARLSGAHRVVALTTQAADFFMALGFEDAAPESLPAGRAQAYDKQRNSRVLARDLGPKG